MAELEIPEAATLDFLALAVLAGWLVLVAVLRARDPWFRASYRAVLLLLALAGLGLVLRLSGLA